MDTQDETQSESSSFETRYANQPAEIADYSVPEIDRRLRAAKAGALVTTKKYGETFLYLRAPPTADLVIMNVGTFLPYKSDIAKKLCELNSLRLGYAARWSCKKKENGRLSARCSAFGSGTGSRSKGFREKTTKRANCPAFCNTGNAENVLEEADQMQVLTVMSELYTEDEDSDEHILCVISSCNWHHVAHSSLLDSGVRTMYTRVADVLNNESLIKSIRRMLDLCGNTRGVVTRIRHQLNKLHPEYMFDENVLRNTIARIRSDSECAQKFVEILKKLHLEGKVEYLHVFLHPTTNVLQGAVWSHAGSRDVVERCGDLLMWDSTHKTTKFLYRLASFILIDSEGKSRPAFLSLALKETAETCKQVLACWHTAFKRRLPAVIITDGDDSMHAAIASVPYSDEIHHLLCTFHLFDLNVKKKVMPILQATGSGSGGQWALFRQGLNMCRESGTEEQFESFWAQLLEEWIPASRQGNQVRKYLHKYVYGTRRQWATCFFPQAFTMGHSSTQRCESWNNVIKLGTTGMQMSELAEYINMQCAEQRKFEMSQTAQARSGHAFQRVPVVHNTGLLKCILDTGISAYASALLAVEFSKAEVLCFSADQPLTVEIKDDMSGRKTLFANGITEYAFLGAAPGAETVCSRTRVHIELRANDTNHVHVNCECHFPYRMKLPCRHVLALGLTIGRDKSKTAQLREFGISENLISVLIRALVMERWRSPLIHERVDQNCKGTATIHNDIFTDVDLLTWSESGGVDFDVPDSGVPTLQERRVTFAQLRSKFSALVDNVTKTETNRNVSQTLSTFADHLFESLQDNIDLDETGVQHMFQQAMKNTFGSSLERTAERFERNGTPDEIQPVHTASRVSNDGPELKKRKIVDPPKRADTRFAGGANLIEYKTRKNRQRRRETSRSLPPGMRTSSKKAMHVPKMMKAGGYACPFCKVLKVQNNMANVLQHVRAKHKDKKDPTIKQMGEAAAERDEEIDNANQSSLQLHDRTDSEPDIDLSKDTGNSNDNLEDTVDEHKKPNLRKFIPQKVHKYQAVGIRWGTRCSRNIREPNSVSEGDTIEIFHPESAAWKSYNVLQNRSDISFVISLKSDPRDRFEVNLRTPSILYRTKRKRVPQPKPSWHLDEESRSKCMKMFRRCKEDPEYKVATKCGDQITAEDYLRLHGDGWLDDCVIVAYLNTMVMSSTHIDDKRFIVLDSQIWKFANSLDDAELPRMKRCLRGCPAYHVDVAISPINVSETHWILCVIKVEEQTIMVIDPKNPTQNAEHTSGTTILKGVTAIFEAYAAELDVQLNWKLDSPRNLSWYLNLPQQPSDNVVDCGVLVCMYAWAILTGVPWPKVSRRGCQVKVQFERMRKKIASFILQ